MASKDFILREIERLGVIFRAIMDRIVGRTTSLAEVKQDLHAAAGSLGVDLELAHKVSPETLLLLVAPGGVAEPTRCWVFAESLFLEGLEANLSGQAEQAVELLTRSRMLYELLGHGRYKLGSLADATERIARIDELLSSISPS